MQRSDRRFDTDASTSAKGAESATEKYILGNKLEEIHLGEGRSHDGSFLKGFGEVLGNLPYLGRVRLGEQVKKGLDLVRVLFKEILVNSTCIYTSSSAGTATTTALSSSTVVATFSTHFPVRFLFKNLGIGDC
ncbi:hypothetical protein DY000_02026330 [Brassica cretica]|uniref:Uncharacterized protein n=1 Tax=Brassica cretica TaxID=69181 RepID=A0ABQ7EJ98_BRACR|nr:hypothetical protein DY000_02026330 [Brassica cretica]